MRGRRVGNSEGRPAAHRDAVRPHCLLTEKPSRDSPPDGTNLQIPRSRLQAASLGSAAAGGPWRRRARLHGPRGHRAAAAAPARGCTPPRLRAWRREAALVLRCLLSCSTTGVSPFLALHSPPATRQRIVSSSHSPRSSLLSCSSLFSALCEHGHAPLQSWSRLVRPPSPKTQLVLVPFSQISVLRSLVFLIILFIQLFCIKEFLSQHRSGRRLQAPFKCSAQGCEQTSYPL